MSPLIDLPHHFPLHIAQTMMFDSLIQYLPDGTIGPKLATSWTVSPDGKEYTFKLDPKAKWWDGQPVTADDVKFTFDTMNDDKSGSSNEGVDVVSKTEVLDPQTVKITIKQLTPFFLAQGGSRGIVPKHVLQGQDVAKSDFNRKPIGSGPFKFVSWQQGQAITMEANAEYFRGAPKIGRLVIKILSDPNLQLTQLRSGEIQYALLDPKDLPAAQQLPGFKLYENPTPRYFDISPNFAKQPDMFGNKDAMLGLLAGIDRQSIVDKVLGGHGKVVDSFIDQVSWAYNPDTPKHPYDKARAQQLLASAGWTGKGSDGILTRNGKRFSFSVVINNFDSSLVQALTVAQQNLKDVGVEMKLDVVEPGIFDSRRSKGDFDAFSRVWNPVYDPDEASLNDTSGAHGYSNAQIDDLDKQALATTDQATRKKIYAQEQVILANDPARLWLYTQNELHFMSDKIQGVQLHPVNVFWNLKDWSINA